MTAELDKMLREFLEKDRRDREGGASNTDLKTSLKNLTDNFALHASDDKKALEKIDQTFLSHHGRLTAAEARIQKIEDDEEDTGAHNRETFERAIRAQSQAEIALARTRSLRPIPRWLERALAPVAVKVGLAVLAGLAAGMGWMLHFVELAGKK